MRLFVYGIFLDEYNRRQYGMTNPGYATVLDYATFGTRIVMAQEITGVGLSLTGLVVTPDETAWKDLDDLEAGYDRIKVRTTSNEEVWMYAAPKENR